MKNLSKEQKIQILELVHERINKSLSYYICSTIVDVYIDLFGLNEGEEYGDIFSSHIVPEMFTLVGVHYRHWFWGGYDSDGIHIINPDRRLERRLSIVDQCIEVIKNS